MSHHGSAGSAGTGAATTAARSTPSSTTSTCPSAGPSRHPRPPRSAGPASSWCATATSSPRSTSTSTRSRSGCCFARGDHGRRSRADRPGERDRSSSRASCPRRTCERFPRVSALGRGYHRTTSTSSSTRSWPPSTDRHGHRRGRAQRAVPAAPRRLPRGRGRRGDGPGGRAPPAGTSAERRPGAAAADPAGRLATAPWRAGAARVRMPAWATIAATYRRSIADPERLLVRRGAGHPLADRAVDRPRREPRAVLPVVPRRRPEHLRERARPARRRRPRRPGRADLRQPGHRHPAHVHLCRAARPGRDLRRRPVPRSACEQGRPGRHLPADGARGRRRDAGLRPARCGALGGLRRLRGQRAGGADRGRPPKVIVSASCGIEVVAGGRVQAAARPRARAVVAPAGARAWSCSGRRRQPR